ncbi:hypothetical protein HanIR_Chr08g0370581 [Helianthus annuus]|nr:hypothetical protein HanIR_Chr08g0370581 [Helianthus annuus]
MKQRLQHLTNLLSCRLCSGPLLFFFYEPIPWFSNKVPKHNLKKKKHFKKNLTSQLSSLP